MTGNLQQHPDHASCSRVLYDQRESYVDWCIDMIFSQFNTQVSAFRTGLSDVFDGCESGYLDGRDLMEMVVGVGDVDVEELKKMTQYDGFEADDQVIVWFWEMLNEMSVSQRIAFLQFATARSRLPTFSHQSKLTVIDKGVYDV